MSTSPFDPTLLNAPDFSEPRNRHARRVEARGERQAARVVLHMKDVCKSLRCGRWKIYNLIKTDPKFPAPRDIAGKLSWFFDEIEEYKATRPYRQFVIEAPAPDHGQAV